MFSVEAVHPDGCGGKWSADAATAQAAGKIAEHLRQQGFLVTITGPDGRLVNLEAVAVEAVITRS